MKIQFAEGVTSDTAQLQNGEDKYSFNRGEQPFEVSEKDWKFLRRSQLFEPVKEVPPTTPAGDSTPSQAETTDQDETPAQDETQPQGEQPKATPPKRASKKAQDKQPTE